MSMPPADGIFGFPDPNTNEADFQAAIVERIRTAFPLLKAGVRVERYLALKLGHHDLKIDGTSVVKTVKGRLDVVVFDGAAPLLLVELKAPHVHITDEDVEQGLSYARLHKPMVPLVLVTNGSSAGTRVVRTYDGAAMEADTLETKALGSILQSASVLAASAVEGSIRTLLGSDPVVWRGILNRWNTEAIGSRTGEIGDFRQPIVQDFLIPRDAALAAREHLVGGATVVVLHGEPLSGVTCALVQIAGLLGDEPCAYIDAANTGDVLQFIAARLSRELQTGVSKDDLRHWLNTAQVLPSLTLIIDGVPLGVTEELLYNATAGRLRLVFGFNSRAYATLRTLPGRSEETSISRVAKAIELTDLTLPEFERAQDLLLKQFNAVFLPGSEIVADLRRPRTLRLVASHLAGQRPRPDITAERSNVNLSIIPAIPVYRAFEQASSRFTVDPRLKHDLSRLAAAYLEDVRVNGDNPERISETYGTPSIDPYLLEASLGETRIGRLSDQGFIHWIDTTVLGPRLVVRLPEVLSHHISILLTRELDGVAVEDIAGTLGDLVNLSSYLPYGDLCLAAAIARVDEPTRLGAVIDYLLNREPQESHLGEGSVIEVLITDRAPVRVHFGDGMNEPVMDDLQPWLILSHLAAIRLNGDDSKPSLNMSILAGIGNFSGQLYVPPPTTLNEIPGFHFHEVDGLGKIPCRQAGIFEPVLQALYLHALRHPDEFDRLVDYAIKEKKPFLVWRLWTVAALLKTLASPHVSAVGMRANAALSNWWNRTQGRFSVTNDI
ncbi:type I restriction enzyme HsdR N-terminal domain-containing protein [Herbaspirillum sp. CAH-3]|uniref:type I restriction enzyme HsdR N-terminal domain-containing protein n=1 Tax=Herbaspirillum sp. CAH-3 TaxID=2605746 RepID=UPI0012ACDA88|nr:type I restriction enzyme HsdR N-terminal domain-containing protein [Herbaspirillum sp. CAH-3]MRT28658.1 type I restriction enzyme HsdR N-terminal domain-containing protein [Herbaspirillum sp. CAH-3]